VLSLAVPAGASAASHGAADSSSASVGGSVYGSAPAHSAIKTRPRTAIRHLGDRMPIRRGMRGHDVKILQDFFNRIGMHVSVDGSFGKGTYRALRRFEKRANLPVDGVVGAEDVAKLRQVLGAGGFQLKAVQPPAISATVPPTGQATVNPDGTATAPPDAPPVVQAIIAAGNAIATKPYRYGGGHGNCDDTGYDCSGSVSYALHGAGLLDVSRDSTGFESFGDEGPGQWVTIYANSGHAYMVVAGLRFDTSGRSKAGTRWQAEQRSGSGYMVRHPTGL
jgi:peptidoglycan hydrolase-like protein with peptidoglycan-binding domain